MPALPFPTYGIANLYLFPVYTTREAYKQATGVEAPAYDPSKPIKSWFDPAAAENPRRKIIYDHVIAYGPNGMPEVGPDGKPFTEPLMIEREWAGTVNISPKSFSATGPTEPPVTGQEVPVPMRPLEAGEELFLQFGGTVAVKNKDLFANLEQGFTGRDRALLFAIADKLGVSR